jgi:hypothetical protein
MTIEKIREAYDAEPFQPFTIHLANGRQIHVAHREFMASSPSGRTIVVYQSDDRHNVIDVMLISDLEFGSQGNTGRANAA